MAQVQQIDQTIIDVAQERGIKPGLLDFHVRELHGWNPADTGFTDEVHEIAGCRREECLLLISEVEAKAAPREHEPSDDCWCGPTVEQVPAPATV
jgi:hypothetical protein